jgi:hypothetical protein
MHSAASGETTMSKTMPYVLACFLFLACLSCRAANGSKVSSATVFDVAAGSSPAIAALGEHKLFVAYEGMAKGAKISDIFFCSSTDVARTWSKPVKVCNMKGLGTAPDIGVETNGAIDIVWSDITLGDKTPDIYFSRSTDQGTTWSPPLNISHNPGASKEPAIAVGPDNSIDVVWQDDIAGDQSADIYFAGSTDAGKTWSKGVNVSKTPGSSTDPAVDVGADGVVHVAWVDTSSGEARPDIYYDRYSNGSWATPEDVTNTPHKSSYPAIACGPRSAVNLCWTDNSAKQNAADVWCIVAGRRGHFGKAVNISSSSGVSSQPAVAADKTGHVAIVWSDTTSGANKPDIYARVSNDGAVTFAPVTDISNTSGRSVHPDVSLCGPYIFVTWEEIESGRSQIKISQVELPDAPAAAPVRPSTPTRP